MEYEILRQALMNFEKQFSCRLTLHNYLGKLPIDLLPFTHVNIYCSNFKKNHDRRHKLCMAFDIHEVQGYISKNNHFFWKQCPCGMLEGCFPITFNEVLYGCMFAGPFMGTQMPLGHVLESKQKILMPEPPAALIEFDLKHFHQFVAYGELLAANLAWIPEIKKQLMPLDDKKMIERFIEQNYRKNIGLPDVAAILHLSISRASNRIFKIFNKGFSDLLRDYRLGISLNLLSHSVFSVNQIAHLCGFNDGAYFHRVFKNKFHCSPLEYRRDSSGASAPNIN